MGNEKLTIIIDTREQLPYSFSDKVEAVKAALPAGDYSIQGFETQIAVERKSLNDFVNTIFQSRERFKIELEKLQTYERACIVVEASAADILLKKYHSKVNPESVWGAMVALTARKNIPVSLLNNRQLACKYVESYLIAAHREVSELCQQKTEKAQREKKPRLTDDLLPAELRILRDPSLKH